MASNITVSGLTATPGIGHIALQWSYTDSNATGLPYRQLDVVEVHAHTSNDRSGASKVAEGRNNALHMALVEGVTYYYWIKARDKEGEYGDWHPSGATSGVLQTVGFTAALAVSGLVNGKLTVTASSNALTATVTTIAGNTPSSTDKVTLAFSASGASWVNTIAEITSSLSCTVTAGSVMGLLATGIPFRIWWGILRGNDGTLHLAAINCSREEDTQVTDGYTNLFRVGILNENIALTSDMSMVDYDNVASPGNADQAEKFWTNTSNISSKYPIQFRLIGYSDFNSGFSTLGNWVTPTITRPVSPGTPRPGSIIQHVAVHQTKVLEDTAVNTPFDDTLPLAAEGEDFVSIPITPQSMLNWFDIELDYNVSIDVAGVITVALYEHNSGSAVLAAQSTTIVTANDIVQLRLRHFCRPHYVGCTYRFRAAGSAGDITLNGVDGARKLGGAMKGYATVREIVG